MNEPAQTALLLLKEQIPIQDPGNVHAAINVLNINRGIKLISQIKSLSPVSIVSDTFAVEIDANSTNDLNIPHKIWKYLKKLSEVR